MTATPLDDQLPLSQLGEGAYWSAEDATFYWVDIIGRERHGYSVADRSHRSWSVAKQVSFAFRRPDGHLLIGLEDGIYDFDPETGSEEPLARLSLPENHRLNDGRVDPSGRIWVGTINTGEDQAETAALYVLREDGLEKFEGGYVNANGKAWSPDGSVMYHADTNRGIIWAYDYDLTTGTPSNRHEFIRNPDWNPDGLCMDPDGRLLVAVYGGSAVEIYSMLGELVDRIAVPAPNVTSCDVGPDGTLYITTAFDGMTNDARRAVPASGAIFVANINSP